MVTLKVDLESTQNYGISIYKGDDSNFYMLNDCGDLLYTDKAIENTKMFEFAIGTFKFNEDKIITQTKEYYEKYYICDKAAYEESLKNSEETVPNDANIFRGHRFIKYDLNGTEFIVIQKGDDDILFKCGGVEFSPYEVLKDFQNFDWNVFNTSLDKKEEKSLKCNTETLFEDYTAADDTDIEEEIQRVLLAMKQLDLLHKEEGKQYQSLVYTLEKLYSIQKEI